MIVLSHFKGHEVAGFGGAIKNLGMGCASAVGKQAQHTARPLIIEEVCIGCGKCVGVCPKTAITIQNEKSSIKSQNASGALNV